MKLLVLTCWVFFSSQLLAETHTVEMLNKDGKESMVYKPMVLKIKAGDKVYFVPKSKGHTTQSTFVPKGAKTWKTKNNEEITLSFEKEGLYLYECKNHGIMGMVGMIQVGEPKNMAEAKEFYKGFRKKFIMNKKRLSSELGLE